MQWSFGIETSSLRCGLLVLVCAIASACDAPATDHGNDEGSVCPTCRRTVGGETGDFGGSVEICGYSQREVDVEEAEALGYPAKAIARAASRRIDVPMTWMPLDSTGGGAASGYDRHTRVFVSLSIDSFMYNERDSDGCDRMYPDPETNASCRSDTAAGSCGSPSFILVNGSGEVHTSDGAVTAVLPSQILEIMKPSYDDISFGPRVDLRDVHGTLRLDPALPEPHVGFLYLAIEYTPNVKLRYGELYVDVFFDDLQLDGGGGGYRPPNNTDYMPLRGVWGTFPYDDSARVGREDDGGTE